MSGAGESAFNLKYHTNVGYAGSYHDYGSIDIDYDTSNVDLEASQMNMEEEIHKQDDMLDQLGGIVSDIKHAATGINKEITRHNDVIDDLTVRIDDADNDIRSGADHAIKIKKDKKCGWCCMIGSIVGISFFSALIIALVIYFTTRSNTTISN